MARSKSSQRWLKEHESDAFVQRSRNEDFRSRAVYKLKEIDERDHILASGMTVVELGAAPGGWTQYVADRVLTGHSDSGRVIATDVLEMTAPHGVEFVCGDFTEDATFEKILSLVGDTRADLVLSDMAPNFSGVAVTDQARAMLLCEMALELSRSLLRPGGSLVCKVFHGAGFDAFLSDLKSSFKPVVIRKPAASRNRSSEVYAVARNLFL